MTTLDLNHLLSFDVTNNSPCMTRNPFDSMMGRVQHTQVIMISLVLNPAIIGSILVAIMAVTRAIAILLYDNGK